MQCYIHNIIFAMYHIYSSLYLCCFDETLTDQKLLREQRVYLAHGSSQKEAKAGIRQGRTWKQEQKQSLRRSAENRLLSLECSACFLR